MTQLATVVDRIRRRLAETQTHAQPAAVAALLREETSGLIGDAEFLALTRETQAELCGAGPLEPFLQDPRITDVLVNGPDDVWIDSGAGLHKVDVRFSDDAAVRRLAQRLAAVAGRRLDDGQPWVDARLPDGTRMHAVLWPISASGTCLSLRTLRTQAFALDDFVNQDGMPPLVKNLLTQIVAARLAFLITGGAGSGKTTMLATMLGLVSPTERLVLVEDVAELQPNHDHVVRLVARQANVEHAGAVELRDLVRQALRMRPDRLVVGEVRGPEVVDLLAALNTGHDGGAGTVHANRPEDLPARLEALGALGGLNRPALHSQLIAAVHVVVHLQRLSTRDRMVSEISLLSRCRTRAVLQPVWRRENGLGPGFKEFKRRVVASGVVGEDFSLEGRAAEENQANRFERGQW